MQQVIYCIALILLAWIAVSDIKKKTIPPVSVILLFFLGFIKNIVLDGCFLLSAICGLLIIGVPMLLLACVVNHGNGIGGGDVKLCAVLGFLLGPVYALFVLMSALLLLVVYSVFAKKDAGYPFAPFVLLGYVLALIFFMT